MAIPHQDELQVWHLLDTPKCVSRVTPESLGQKAPITAWRFVNDDRMVIGHRDGGITLYDCRKNEVLERQKHAYESVQSVANCEKEGKVVVYFGTKGIVVDEKNLSIKDQFPLGKKQTVQITSVSLSEQAVIECFGNTAQIRGLKDKQLFPLKVSASQKITACHWIDK